MMPSGTISVRSIVSRGRNPLAGSGLTAAQLLDILLTVDGAGSGLDADLLDGQSSAFHATASSVSDHLADTIDAHDASAISVAPSGSLAADDVQEALLEILGDIEAHIADASAAHAAAAISYNGGTGMSATDVEAAIDELATEKATAAVTITAGNGLTGSGDLSANRTLTVGGSTSVIAGSDDIQRAALTGAVAAAQNSNVTTSVINLVFVIGDGVNVITTGVKGYFPIDFACTITGWTLVADVSGSIDIDVWRDTYANFPTTDADSITGSEIPRLSAQQKNQDLSLGTWTTSVAAGDVLGVNVDSASLVKQVTLALRATKTG